MLRDGGRFGPLRWPIYSETPADLVRKTQHTDWKERTEGFREKYHSSAATLRFIKTSMINAVHLLDHPAPGVYEDLLQDMFYVNEPIEAKDRDKQVKQPKPEVESRSHVFDVSKVDGGFRVSISKGQTSFPVNVAVTVAYDTRRGNPFARYSSLDFDLEDNSMQIDITKGKLLQRIRNKITARVEGADFVLSVTGFDQHRDIITDIREES